MSQEELSSFLRYFNKMFHIMATNQISYFYDLYDYSILEPQVYYDFIEAWGPPSSYHKSKVLYRLIRPRLTSETYYYPIEGLSKDILVANFIDTVRDERAIKYTTKLTDFDEDYFDNLFIFTGHIAFGGGLRMQKTRVNPDQIISGINIIDNDIIEHVPMDVIDNAEVTVKKIEKFIAEYIRSSIVNDPYEPNTYKIGWDHKHGSGHYGWAIMLFAMPWFAISYELFYHTTANMFYSFDFIRTLIFNLLLILKYYFPYDSLDLFLTYFNSYEWTLKYSDPMVSGMSMGKVPLIMRGYYKDHGLLQYYKDVMAFSRLESNSFNLPEIPSI
jgi:hypothetical protein